MQFQPPYSGQNSSGYFYFFTTSDISTLQKDILLQKKYQLYKYPNLTNESYKKQQDFPSRLFISHIKNNYLKL